MQKDTSSCMICPHQCGANRTKGETGLCGAGNKMEIAAATLHHWEEPCLSGTRGSGTVFFCHCSLQCVYCQNHRISRNQNEGTYCSPEQLADIFCSLQEQGAHNINLVTPTHYVLQIIEALRIAKKRGLTVPVVYNSSGYESISTLKLLSGWIDIYLPDFKFFSPALSERYSSAANYMQVTLDAIQEMVCQTDSPCFGRREMLKSGVLVRHLVLPSHTEDSKNVLELLHRTFKNKILISIMNQYTPIPFLTDFPELIKPLSVKEYEEVVRYARQLGIEQAYIQENGSIGTQYVPDFSLLK